MTDTNKNFKVRHGLTVGEDKFIVDATQGDTTVGGNLTLSNNTIKKSGGTDVITFSGTNLTTVTGDLVVAGNTLRSNTAEVLEMSGSNATFQNDLTVTGNLTVNGSTTTIDTTNLVVEDNTILLNKNQTGSGVTAGTAGIEIERGDLSNVSWVWNESNKWWEPVGGSGTAENTIWAAGDIISGTSLATNGTDLTFNNDDGAGATTTIKVKKGGGNYAAVRLNISTNRWETTVDNGTTWIEIPNQDLDTDGTPTFAQLSVDNIRLDANTISSTNTNGAITLDPNGTGDINLTTAAGANAILGTNLVRGVVRDATTKTNGDIWSFSSGASTGFRGVSVDNSDATTKGPGVVLRSFTGSSAAANTTRGRLIVERARGTSATPEALQSGDFFGGIDTSGYATDRWANDANTGSTGLLAFTASETWANTGTTVTNCGTQFQISLHPAATTLSATSAFPVFQLRPEGLSTRSNTLVLARGTAPSWSSTGSSISGTTLTIGGAPTGTIAVGHMISGSGVAPGTYITANISGSGAGSTWTVSVSQTVAATTIIGVTTYITATAGSGNLELSQAPVLRTNTIKTSAGTTAVTLTANNTLTTIKGDVFLVEKNAGDDLIYIDGSNANIYATKTNYRHKPSTDPAYGGEITMKIGQLNGSDDYAKTTELSVTALTTDGSRNATYETKTLRFNGTNYSPTQSGDLLGRFTFLGNYASGTTPASANAAGFVGVRATENWTSTASGAKMTFSINKTGTNDTIDVIEASPTTTTMRSDTISLANSSGVALTSDKITYTRSYGEFAFTNTSGFGITAIDTIYTMPLDTTNFSSGITLSGTGSVNINVAGTYKLIMSLQADMVSASAGSGQFDFWLRKNGVDVANSNTQIDLLKLQKSVIAMDWMVQSDGNDYFEIVYASHTTTSPDIKFSTIAAQTTPYVRPLAPALILNVIPVGA